MWHTDSECNHMLSSMLTFFQTFVVHYSSFTLMSIHACTTEYKLPQESWCHSTAASGEQHASHSKYHLCPFIRTVYKLTHSREQ